MVTKTAAKIVLWRPFLGCPHASSWYQALALNPAKDLDGKKSNFETARACEASDYLWVMVKTPSQPMGGSSKR